ncbi:putative UPF0481 protein At3g02645 [Cryptomeria japonica]|uniref:putative UPF0481 protein At3g02645 n=1 Tax=Cryptomeria japonica TaxID=3369 RepID=UPI0027DA830E|nr:putative UPF0481 protein At3g02645 [Cryptomeria japonica]
MDKENTVVVQWLEETRKDSHVSEVGRDKRLASIFMVPITLKENDVIFTPQAISIGPYHFLKPHLAEMESEKSQIIERKVMRKLPQDFFAPLQKVEDGDQSLSDLQDDCNFSRIVVPCCRDFYGDAQFLQNLDQEAFSRMLFRDASFLLLFLEHHVVNPQHKKKMLQPQQPSASNNSDPFHDLKSGTGLWLGVMKDIFKLENQIPLSTLESLYAFIGNPNQSCKAFLAKVCSEYSPLWIQPSGDADLVSNRHLLNCIHATVYRKPPVGAGQNPPSGQNPINGWSPFTWLKNNCVWDRGSNSDINSKEGYTQLQGKEVRLPNYRKTAVPCVSELRKAGVKFKCCEGGIEQIRFDKSQSTLYLPVLRIGQMTETIIRNLIAFELCTPKIEENAVIGFTRLLKELTQDAKDAEVLRTNEIFVSLGVSDDEIVEIVRNLSRLTWKPCFKPVKDVRKSLKTYYKGSKSKVLWSEFLETYCSKPWVFISALAATVLLGMTAVQVFCLFNKNS